jgi:hypothetical protein
VISYFVGLLTGLHSVNSVNFEDIYDSLLISPLLARTDVSLVN